MQCDVCGRINGHLRGCPEYEDEEIKPNHYCSICGNGIYDGEDYIENDDGEYIHYDCPTTRELVGFLGYEIKTMRGDSY